MTAQQVDMPKPLMCPVMTTVQIVPRGLQTTEFGLGVGPSRMPVTGPDGKVREVSGFAATGKLQAIVAYKVKTENRNMNDPPLEADSLVVNCQGAACKFWDNAAQDCRYVTGAESSVQSVKLLTEVVSLLKEQVDKLKADGAKITV